MAAGEETALFYGDVDGDRAAAAALRLRPQAAASFGQPVTGAGWRGLPSTYVVCTRGRTIPPAAQREFAQHCSEVVELPSSHSPFLSRPADVADLLVERLTGG
ncbi:MAG: alpha/beta fold hydrolase [Actinomycetota bacterium]|nr:alpha/beta fold hydrolase [Actinomycetota bacterium]